MTTVISVRGLSKRFGEQLAVDQLDMDIPQGQVYGFLGPNGSGKTTALRMMCGLLLPTEGEISVLGMAVPQHADAVRRKLGYMTQRFSLYQDLSARQNLKFVATIQGVPRKERQRRVGELIDRFELGDIADSLAGSLSGGQKRKLALAAAVVHEPPLLILDEPTSEVDPNTRRYFWDTLFDMCDTGTTILVTTHLMDEAERCHHLAVMERGRKVADGSPTDLKRNLQVTVLELGSPRLSELRALVHVLPDVISVTQTGMTLRVLLPVSVADVEDWITRSLDDLATDLKWQRVAISIEDVFVVSTGGARAR